MTDSSFPDFDTMTPADFEKYLPEFFSNGDGHVSTDPRLQKFLANHPDCAALVRDLEAIADQARSLFETDPSDAVWTGIQDKLKDKIKDQSPEDDDFAIEDCGFARQCGDLRGDGLHAMGPVKPGAREELDAGALFAGLNAVAVEFELVEPAAAGRRDISLLGELRRDEVG